MLRKIQLVNRYLVRWSAVVALTMATQLSHAALFEDDEARRAIIDLRQRMQLIQDQLSKIATSESILDLANQNEQLRSELAQLRGQNEQLARAVDELRALVNSADSRLSQLEPATVTVDNENFSVGPKEKADYETAMTALRGGNFEVAGGVLTALLQEFPESGYVPSALFWLGNAHYATGQYAAALKTFNELTTRFVEHARVPEAMLAKANCQVELRDKRGAKANLEELIRKFPSSEAAQAAKQRLDALK